MEELFAESSEDSGAARERPGVADSLVDRISNFVKRFVFLKERSLYLLIALWVIATYIYEEFDNFGYLFVFSPEPQSGKTRLLEILQHVVRNPSDVLVSPTEAVLFRTAKGATQLLDEVDTWANGENLRAVLNAGYKKSGCVTRLDKTKEGGYKPVAHSVYCPRALAGIGLHILGPATRDRTFMLRMDRQTKDERRERLSSKAVQSDAAGLREGIEGWVAKNRQAIVSLHEAESFNYLEKFSDRTVDVASPLAAILEVICKGRSDATELREAFLQALGVSRAEIQPNAAVHIFEQLLTLSESEDPVVGNVTELAAMLGFEPEQQGTISAALRRHGFDSKSHRKEGEDPKKRYALPRKRLQEIVERYGS